MPAKLTPSSISSKSSSHQRLSREVGPPTKLLPLQELVTTLVMQGTKALPLRCALSIDLSAAAHNKFNRPEKRIGDIEDQGEECVDSTFNPTAASRPVDQLDERSANPSPDPPAQHSSQTLGKLLDHLPQTLGGGAAAILPLTLLAASGQNRASVGSESLNPFGTPIIKGTVTAGPVIENHQLWLKVMAADGRLLAEGSIDSKGFFVIPLTEAYTGAVVLQLTDRGLGNDYWDEASKAPRSLSTSLHAIAVIQQNNEVLTVNITPLTDIAAQLMGYDPSRPAEFSANDKQINSINHSLAHFFKLTNENAPITALPVIPVISSSGADQLALANSYGKLLAAIASGTDSLQLSTPAGLSAIVEGLEAQNNSLAFQQNDFGLYAQRILGRGVMATEQSIDQAITLGKTLGLNILPLLNANQVASISAKTFADMSVADLSLFATPQLQALDYSHISLLNSWQINVLISRGLSIVGFGDDGGSSGPPPDTTPPATPSLVLGAGVGDGATSDEALAVSGVVEIQAELGATVELTFTNDNTAASVTQTVTATGAAQAITLTASDLVTLGHGPITVSAVAEDAAGNVSNAATATFTLTASTATIATVATDDVLNSSEKTAGVTVSGTATLASSVTLQWNGVTQNVSVSGLGAWSYLFTSNAFPLTDGATTLTVTPYNAANVAGIAATRTVTFNTAPATMPTINTVSGSDVVSAKAKAAGVTITGTAGTGAQVDVSWNGTQKSTTAAGGTWSVNYATAEIPANGSYTLSATANENGGDPSVANRSVSVQTTIQTVPSFAVLLSHSPAAGNNVAAYSATSGAFYYGSTLSSNKVIWGTTNASRFGNNGVAFTDAGTSSADLFSYDVATGINSLITHNATAGNASAGSASSSFSDITPDGAYVIFNSTDATQFGNNGTAFTDGSTTSLDLFAYEIATGTISLITHNSTAGNTAAGAQASNLSFSRVSNNSQYVIFTAKDASQFGNNGTSFTDGNTSNNDLFAYKLSTGEISLITHDAASAKTSSGSGANLLRAVSANSQYVAFTANDATQFGQAGVAFTDAATSSTDIFIHDLSTGENALVTHNKNAGNGASYGGSDATWSGMTSDSQYVIFTSTDATKFGNNGQAFTDAATLSQDLFAYEISSGILSLLSHSAASTTHSTGPAGFSGISPDGKHVVFNSNNATNFGNNGIAFTDGNTSRPDLFVADLASGETRLVTHNATSGNLSSGAAISSYWTFSSDSKYLVFSAADATQFGNNGISFTDGSTTTTDLFAYEMATGVTRLISHNATSGNLASGNSAAAVVSYSGNRLVSPDGKYVIFSANDATQFGNNGIAFTDTNTSGSDYFSYHFETGAINLITHTSKAGHTEAFAASAGVTIQSFTPDGQYLIFTSTNASQFGNDGVTFTDSATATLDVFSYSLSTGVIRLLNSNSTGLATVGTPTLTSTLDRGITPDGNLIHLGPPSVSDFSNAAGTTFTNGSAAIGALIGIRLNILDLPTAYDNGVSSIDNITTLTSFTIDGYCSANTAVTLKDNDEVVATATSSASGVATFSLTAVSSGNHEYTLWDSTTGMQLSLTPNDYLTGAARLQVVVA